jgi:hypothetical protein
MNQLNPELKRLLRWARQSPVLPPEEVSQGFSQRVVRQHWSSGPVHDSPGMWQRVILGSVWPATAILLLGLAILMLQKFNNHDSYELLPAYEVVSAELIP